jgi:hypothetical protein
VKTPGAGGYYVLPLISMKPNAFRCDFWVWAIIDISSKKRARAKKYETTPSKHENR